MVFMTIEMPIRAVLVSLGKLFLLVLCVEFQLVYHKILQSQKDATHYEDLNYRQEYAETKDLFLVEVQRLLAVVETFGKHNDRQQELVDEVV